MGGKLAIVHIASNGKIMTGKISTHRLHEFNSLYLLDEKRFNEFQETSGIFHERIDSIAMHDEYDGKFALFAPYHYGIVIFDFQRNKVFYYNDHSSFMNCGINNIIMEYSKIGATKQKSIPIKDLQNKLIATESIFLPNRAQLITPGIIQGCIDMGGILTVNKEAYTYSVTDDYFSVAAKLFGEDLSLLTSQQAKAVIQQRQDNIHENNDIQNWGNIQAGHPEWEIFNGFKEKEDMNKAYSFYKEAGVLTEEDVSAWHLFSGE